MFFVSATIESLRKFQYQILATLAVNIIGFSHGHAVAWVAPTLPVLLSDVSPLLTGPITIEEASWIGAIVCIGGFVGTLVFGAIANQIGCKKSMYLITVPHLAFWLMLMFGTTVPHLYVARILSGITGGAAFVAIPTFVADIADNKIRGTLGAMLGICFNGGILSGFIFASYLTYSLFPRVIVGLSIFSIISIYCLPETPQYLLRAKRYNEAESALRFYRNFKVGSASKEECQDFNEHLANLKNSIHGDINNKRVKLSYRDFIKPSAVKGLCIGLSLLLLHQFSGLYALVSYTSNIFQMSGSNLDPNTCTIIIGTIQLLGTLLSANFVDRIGRRILLISSCLGVAIRSIILGIFSYMSLSQDLTSISWLAVTSMSFTILLGSVGLMPLPIVVLTEIIPQKIKDIAVTFCMAILMIMSFVVLKVYPILMVSLGIAGVMWISSGITIVGALAIFFLLPETKGKILEISED